MASLSEQAPSLPRSIAARFNAWLCGMLGYVVLAMCCAGAMSLLTWQIADPSLTHAASGPVRNALGPIGAIISDLIIQLLGLAGVFIVLPPVFWALQLIGKGRLDGARAKLMLAPVAVLLLACAASSLPRTAGWPLPYNVGGLLGDTLLRAVTGLLAMIRPERASAAAGLFCFAGGTMLLMTSLGLSQRDLRLICQRPRGLNLRFVLRAWERLGEMSERAAIVRREPTLRMPQQFASMAFGRRPLQPEFMPEPRPRPQRHVPEHDCEAEPFVAAADTEIDRKGLDRILSICAPENAGKPRVKARDAEPPVVLVEPEPEEWTDRHHSIVGPIQAARSVMAAPHDGMANIPHRSSEEQVRRWPASEAPPPRMPPTAPPASGWRPQSLPGGDSLYGRAVAIVLDDRKASAEYLQRRLDIGYMRAADLIERMEREGILGAPVYNGLRPILIGGSGSREV